MLTISVCTSKCLRPLDARRDWVKDWQHLNCCFANLVATEDVSALLMNMACWLGESMDTLSTWGGIIERKGFFVLKVTTRIKTGRPCLSLADSHPPLTASCFHRSQCMFATLFVISVKSDSLLAMKARRTPQIIVQGQDCEVSCLYCQLASQVVFLDALPDTWQC